MAHTPASMPNPEGTPSHGCGNVVWSHLVPTTISTMTRISKGRRMMCLTIPMYDAPNCLSFPGFMFGTVAPIPPSSPRTSTHRLPQLPSRPPSTHTPWSGRGSGRQGGARRCTNDLDALGRTCSALPGSKVVGMGAHNAHHESAGTRERRPDHPVP